MSASGTPMLFAPPQPPVALPEKSALVIGRSRSCDVTLSSPDASRRHAEIVPLARGWLLRDLGSTNGTFVNGLRIKQVEGLRDGDLLQFATEKFEVSRGSDMIGPATVSADVAGHAIGYAQFDKLLMSTGVIPHYQPIVRLDDSQRIGFEVLARSRLIGLETPAKMFRVASERSREMELSCQLRAAGLRAGNALAPEVQLYLNTHPAELNSSTLFQTLEQLRDDAPDRPLVLEIHESAATSSNLLSDLNAVLSDLNISLAYDDFGAGQARLLELVDVPPDVIKFDICLVQGLADAPAERRQMVGSLVEIVRNLGVTPLAEGIETLEEATVCRELGFKLAQGFYFGRPAPVMKWVDRTDG